METKTKLKENGVDLKKSKSGDVIFDPNFILKGIDGKPLEGEMDQVHAGKLMALSLFYSTENRLKFHGWALKLYAMQPLELDEADVKILKDFIEKSKLPAITYAPLMKLLEP